MTLDETYTEIACLHAALKEERANTNTPIIDYLSCPNCVIRAPMVSRVISPVGVSFPKSKQGNGCGRITLAAPRHTAKGHTLPC